VNEQRTVILLPDREITDQTVTEIIAGEYGHDVGQAERDQLFSPQSPLTTEHLNSLGHIAAEGQELMVARHGGVWPVYQIGSEACLGYNNGDHTRQFSWHMERLGTALGHTSLQKRVHSIIPPWHDIVQKTVIQDLPRTGSDERQSAEQLIRRLRDKGLPAAVAEIAAYGIVGTWPVMNEANMPIGQWAVLQEDYPSEAARLAAHMAATCDLVGIYAPDGPLSTSYLSVQRQGLSPWMAPSLTVYERFLAGNLPFLEHHTFPIEQANKLFTDLKPAVLEHQAAKLSEVHAFNKAGYTLEEAAAFWHKVLLNDMQFANKHR
jgi:hypothetical protein